MSSAGAGHGDGYGRSTSPRSPSPFHLLEVTVISAQNLHRRRFRFGRRVRAYAVAWADRQAQHKLRTDVDRAGGAAPTWNDRFLFRVDDAFLRSETAAVTVEVRGVRSLQFGPDPVLGVTRIVVSTFLRRRRRPPDHGRQVAALLLRRPRSLRPQGIINVAVALLDDAHAALLYDDAPGSSHAFAVKDLVVTRSNKIAQQQAGDDRRHHPADDEKKPAPAFFVDHQSSGRLDSSGSAAIEQRKLEQTLEKWKADLSPGRKEDGRGGAWRPAFCFRGS